MQLLLTLQCEMLRLPLAYGRLVQGMLYHGGRTEEGHSAFLHDVGYRAEGRSFRLFTFGQLTGPHSVSGREIVFWDRVELEIRSTDARFIQSLLGSFVPGRELWLGENAVTVQDCALSDRHILEEHITIQTLSPITVYHSELDGHTLYFSPEDPRFAHGVEQNARRKWQSYHGSGEPPAFSFRVPAGEQCRKTVTTYQGIYITGWNGRFELEGAPMMLDFLYQTGLGAKNAQGFGMFRTAE